MMSESLQLQYTQALRKKLIEHLVKENEGKITSDLDEIRTALQAAKDMDAQELTVMRIQVDDKNGQSAKEASALIVQALTRLAPEQMKHNLTHSLIEGTADDRLGDREYVEGEMSIGDQGLTPELLKSKQNTTKEESE